MSRSSAPWVLRAVLAMAAAGGCERSREGASSGGGAGSGSGGVGSESAGAGMSSETGEWMSSGTGEGTSSGTGAGTSSGTGAGTGAGTTGSTTDAPGEEPSFGFTPTGVIAFSNTNTRRGEWDDEGGLGTDARNFVAYVASGSRAYVPDIVTLQETENRFAANYRSCEEFRADLEARVRAKGHPKMSGYSMYPPHADSWEGGSCVIFRRRWSYVEHAWIYPYFEEDGVQCTRREDDTKPKVLVVRLRDEADGRRIAVASVHLDKGPAINCHQETLEDVAAHPLMSGVAGQIIAGDFNNGKGELAAPAGWSRVPLTSSEGEAWTHGKSQPLAERTTLDHIFVKGGAASEFGLVGFDDARIVSEYDYSDHRGGVMVFAY